MHTVRAAGLAQPKKLMSNTALAAILASFVGISYYWSMHSVGSTDLEKEVALEVRCTPHLSSICWHRPFISYYCVKGLHVQ
jgi:hypothetical protein